VMEADIYRSEAKLAALKQTEEAQGSSNNSLPFISYARGDDGEVLPEDPDEVPKSKADGFDRWVFEMTIRFLKGDDPDINYKEIDENDELDIIELREEEERYFEDEEPEWVGEDAQEGETIGGETGIQDF